MDFQLEHAVGVLRATPGVLRAWLWDLGAEWTHSAYGEATFSPFDVVGHLIHGERADWMVRLHIILEHGESRPFEPFDRYAMYEASRGCTLRDLLETFARLRAENLLALTELKLSTADLARRGVHPNLGPVTAGQLLATWVAHDLNHIHQIAKAMAWQYRDAIGPWSRHMPLISSGNPSGR